MANNMWLCCPASADGRDRLSVLASTRATARPLWGSRMPCATCRPRPAWAACCTYLRCHEAPRARSGIGLRFRVGTVRMQAGAAHLRTIALTYRARFQERRLAAFIHANRKAERVLRGNRLCHSARQAAVQLVQLRGLPL